MGAVVTALVLSACESLPQPRMAYQDEATQIQLRHDGQAGSGHSHPARVSADRMTQILQDLRVQKRGDPVFGIVTGNPEEVPAFSVSEIRTLAPALSKALAAASPQEIVTFYRRTSDQVSSVGVISGGLFLEGHQLYFVLANHRNRPSDVMSQAVSTEFDPTTDPLLSLKARSYAVKFRWPEALVPDDTPLVWRYVDPGKFMVIDLDRLPVRSNLSSLSLQ